MQEDFDTEVKLWTHLYFIITMTTINQIALGSFLTSSLLKLLHSTPYIITLVQYQLSTNAMIRVCCNIAFNFLTPH